VPGPPPRPEAIPALAREQFPALTADPGVVYLDSAATTQKPRPVIDAVTAALSGRTANPGRGSYPWSAGGARRIAEVREQAARFIGAAGADEIVFTTGATAGLNAVALSWGLANLADGDEILYSPHDHTSNVYPWVRLRQLLARSGRRVSLVPYAVTAAGEADTADIAAKVSPRTRLITVAHVHHVFGGLTTLEELRGRLGPSVRLCFDCTQSAGHVPLDVARLGCDFAVLSGHKMFGVPGTGVLYARRRVHHELTPFLPGGGSGVRLAAGGPGGPCPGGPCLGGLRMPDGLEGGTPDLPGISALGAAMEFIDGVGLEPIAEHNQALTRFLVERLAGLPGVTLLPGPAWAACPVGYGIVSFRVDGVRSDDVGFALSSRGFYVRTGSHCIAGGQYDDSARVSVHAYNAGYELERFTAFLALIAEGTL
jgi:cysteine desulfurase/selenocysteine lyase